MTEKANPSVNRPVEAFKTAGAIGYGGATGGASSNDGFVVPGSSPTDISSQDGGIDETVLNEFQETSSGSSFDVTIDPGEAFVFGSWIAIDTSTTVTLASSTNNQTVYAGWNKDGSNDVIIGLDAAFASASGDTDEKIPLWTFDTDGSGVTSVTDERIVGKLLNANVLYNERYGETVNSLGSVSGTTSIDLSTSNLFEVTVNGDTTFTFDNPITDVNGNSFTMYISMSGSNAITWPSSVDWDGGSAPSDPADGEALEVSFISYDGGTSWKGRPSWSST